MNFWQRIGHAFMSKESQTRIALSFQQTGRPKETPANYEAFSYNGFQKNAVVYTCIKKIITAASSVHWNAYQKKSKDLQELSEHPILNVLKKPNPLMSTSTYIEEMIGFKLIAGNAYHEANTVGGKILELWPVRPDKMRVVPGANGYVSEYVFKNGHIERRFDVEEPIFRSQIMHWKSFHPRDEFYGMSPLEAAILQLDQNNAGQKWNLSLLQNSAAPSGVLQMVADQNNPRGSLTDEQVKRLRDQFEEGFQGADNSGRPLVLEGGLQWTQMSLSPKEMDFLKSKEVTATDIAGVYGVPPEVLGLGQKTFSNYKEARLAFYEDTVLPELDSFKNMFNMWAARHTEDSSVFIDYDKDKIEALQERREQKFTSLANVTYLTINEKREAVGYEAIDGGDKLDKPGGLLGGFGFGNDDGDDDDKPENNNDDKPNNNDETQDEDEKQTLSSHQVDTIFELVERVEKGSISKKSATYILKTAFKMSEDESNEIIGGINVQSENTPAGNSDTDSEDDEGFKSINLINQNEKRNSWRKQNRLRKQLEASFTAALLDDFTDMISDLGKTANLLQNSEIRLLEYSLIKKAIDHEDNFKKTIKRHLRYSLLTFGEPLLDAGKSQGLVIETKSTRSKFMQFVDAYIERYTGEQIKTIFSTSEDQIRSIVKGWTTEAIESGDSVNELSKYLEAEFEELKDTRAKRIARTEVSRASNNGSLGAAKSLGVEGLYKEWVTAGDGRVRDEKHANHQVMNGVEVPINEKFDVPPDATMDGPGDIAAEASQVINCRCVLVYKQKKENG